jgi:predicted DNA-binding protein
MTKTSLSSRVVATRVPPETRARFAALAARHHLSASTLLAKMVDEVLKTHGDISLGSDGRRSLRETESGIGEADRITLRLRKGDRALATGRARARGMKTGSYLALLIHNHVRDEAVLPPNELDQIKVIGARLAALGRQLRLFGMPNTQLEPVAPDLSEAIVRVRQEIEVAREATAAIVRRNLISWETGEGSRMPEQIVRLPTRLGDVSDDGGAVEP